MRTRQSRIADFSPGHTVRPQSLHNERAHCWRPLANEIKLRQRNPCCLLASHFDYALSQSRAT